MKCINRILAVLLVPALALSASGCGKKETEIANRYNIYQTAYQTEGMDVSNSFFAESLCVGGLENLGTDTTDSQVAEGAGVFHTATGEITYAQNIYERLYPASTTKILTAYIALKEGNLDDVVTVSENAVDLESDSSNCGLLAGDKMTLRDLLYGLMMRSGNDAAIAIAEHLSGDTESFAVKMNEEARMLGATASHFVNPNGLPDENHYTSVYDLYLMFQAAIKDDTFCDLIRTTSYTTNYTHADGSAATQDWSSTNRYFSGEATAPEGFTVIGGKTGTTGDAGYCLVLLTENAAGEQIISIVLKADCRSNLYLLMNQVLSGYGN